MTETYTAPVATSLYSGSGRSFKLNLHHGQAQAWDSDKRIVAVFAGTRSGKTATGPWWLYREIQRRGPGDYMAVTSDYSLFDNAMLPAMQDVFERVLGIGRYWASKKVIELKNPATGMFQARRATDSMWGRVLLRSAAAPGGLEAARIKAAWLDEVGQDQFKVESWEAILRRVAIDIGRLFLTTTIYNFNWLKAEVYDRWEKGDPNIDVIHFESIDNPSFPVSEWARARETMPPWRFAMQYRGRYAKPAGSIYDCYNDQVRSDQHPEGHLVKRFDVPAHWPRYMGIDFGGAHTAAVFLAYDPALRRCYAYREYLEGHKVAGSHRAELLRGESGMPLAYGGSWGEGQWREEFAAAGLHVYPPLVREVEIGIARVYAALKTGNLFVFSDLRGLRGELAGYSRKLDATGQQTAEIEHKNRYHILDSLRYIGTYLWASIDGRDTSSASIERTGVMPQYRYGGAAGPE